MQLPIAALIVLPFIMSSMTDHVFSGKNVQRLIHDENAKFDLIINHELFCDSLLMLGHKFNAPAVSISMNLALDFCGFHCLS